ncbi:hypothetical protein BDV38DRAFT_282039 [Aspergillus pseudotamarii]|uniref:Subtilisin-like serine protease n=1 Tax=Aspergillus pseudotamarii TaxID=132259 RepID=A0A5N6SY95_ASPPS|nr:uncharacterized protein BDV38DRAFT_282039 [Aspergillus pseudotamarii]KAE8138363.1 hypothetical protein BDV38DRAFT_282039 [Aspergillus pseudotamarii]
MHVKPTPIGPVPFSDSDALNAERLICAVDRSTAAVSGPTLPHDPSQPGYHVPDEPSVPLTDSENFLRRELTTPLLDLLFGYLWLVGKQSSSNIDALHAQVIKGRDILPAEDPKLHLIWQEKRIFIKPIPQCLLNYDFWRLFLSSESPMIPSLDSPSELQQVKHSTYGSDSYRTVALGFLRSYSFLIQHRSDLSLAKEHHLIPKDIEWSQWSRFISVFRSIDDGDVAKRYWYGQLRLTRLNWVLRILGPRSDANGWFYHEPHWSTIPYMRRAVVPLVFMFAGISLMLASMQVMLAVPSDSLLSLGGANTGSLEKMQVIFWGFSLATVFFSSVSLALLILIPLIVIVCQLSWAIRHKPEKLRIDGPPGVTV